MRSPDKDQKRYVRRLLESRLRILCRQGFYGSLLMHMEFRLDDTVGNVAADRRRISFNPGFLDAIDDKELDFVLIHEVVHLSLRHNSRRKACQDKDAFDMAADVVVNSNILKSCGMREDSIKLCGRVQDHKAPDGSEGYEHSAEELYDCFLMDRIRSGRSLEMDEDGNVTEGGEKSGFDDHGRWDPDEDDGISDADWQKYVFDACETMYVRDPSNSRGLVPGYAARMYLELKEGRTDWRTLLNNFVQEEVNDYSFAPPDRRFSESPFFLPDFNDRDEIVKDVLFMIDTSGSMSDQEITEAYSEVRGAIAQFGGRLQGWLGFFDAAIVEPKPFSDEEDLKIIRPYGGGGTSFTIVFSYVRDKMRELNVSSIVILTDGYAPWPREEAAMEIPVIWLINNDEMTPPWGKVARMRGDEKRRLL